jgi:ATP-binding cassette subfamily G (WHITE) protein 2
LELCDELKNRGELDLAIVDTASADTSGNSDGSCFDDDEATHSHANNYFYETHLILRRNLTNIFRTKELFFARIGACVGFGIMIGSLFYKRPRTAEGVIERVAYLVFALAFFLYTSLEALPIFLAEREIFQREYSRGAYRAISYVTAVTAVYLPFLFILSLIFVIASWWLVGMPQIAETFWFYVFTLLCTNAAGQSFAVLLSVLVPDPMAGQSGGSGLLSVMFLFSGFFIKASRIPRWWKWLHYLSLFKYSYDSSVINALKDHLVTTDGLSNYEVLKLVSVEGINKWRGVGILIAFTLFYRMCFYFVLITSYNGSRKK